MRTHVLVLVGLLLVGTVGLGSPAPAAAQAFETIRLSSRDHKRLQV